MSTGLISLLPALLGMSALELGLGGAVGWWMGRSQGGGPKKMTPETDEELTAAPASPAPALLDECQTRELLARMQELAAGMADHVDLHSAKVQAASHELAALPGGATALPAAVVQAVSSILEANQRLQGQLASASEKIQEQTQQIEARLAESRTDVLTGLANRRAFDDEIAQRLVAWRDRRTTVALIMLDVDHFKKFNDRHGHLAGDEVLRGVARVLATTVGQAGLAARYGGEEFAAIVPGADADVVRHLTEDIRRAIESSRFRFENAELAVTASLGVARPLASEEAAAWIKRADEALYASKKGGRNCATEHDGRECHRITPAKAASISVIVADPPAPAPVATTAPAADALTGLHTRRSLLDHLELRLAERRRTETPLTVALIEVDGLTEIRQQYGAALADKVLCATAQFLRAALRDMDIIARHSDDMFSILLPGTSLPSALKTAERIRQAIFHCESLRHDDGAPLRFTVSIGLGDASSGDRPDSLIERAAAAVQSAIDAGRNCSSTKPCAAQLPADRPVAMSEA